MTGDAAHQHVPPVESAHCQREKPLDLIGASQLVSGSCSESMPYHYINYIYIYIHIWVNYNDLTATSLEIMVSKGNHPQIALIQVSEIL